MWVTVSAQTLAGPAIITAAEDTVAQVRGTTETKQMEIPGPQIRQATRSPATEATDGQQPGSNLPDSKVIRASGAPQSHGGGSASARPVSASKPAVKPRRGMAAGTGRQPVETSSQRQRPKPRRAPAVILDVIDDRMANGAVGELDTGPAASAAVPVYEREAAALGTAVPAQPSTLDSVAAGRAATADGEPPAKSASVQAEQAAPQGSAAGADAPAPYRPADGHAQADPGLANGMLMSPMTEPAPSLTNAAGSRTIERPVEEQHRTAALTADLVAGNDRGDGGTPASPLPEVAALSLEATNAVAAAEHEAEKMQLVVQHAAAAHAEVQGPPSGANTMTQPPDSTADRAADVASPAESPPEFAAHSDHAHSIAVDGVQASSVTAANQSAAVAVHCATGTQRRPKKRRRKATALGSSVSLPGAAAFASTHVPSCTLLVLMPTCITTTRLI